MKTKAQNDIDEIISISIPQIIELDEAEGITYKAHAPIGTDATIGLTLPVWTIYRIRTSGVRTITEELLKLELVILYMILVMLNINLILIHFNILLWLYVFILINY